MDIKELLNAVQSGRCSVDEAAAQIKQQNFDDLGFAKLDYQRRQRTGGGETIYCPGKNLEQLAEIVRNFHARALPMLGTRCSREQFEFLQQFDLPLEYDAVSKILVLSGTKNPPLPGLVAVCTGGTADIPTAEEAARCVEFFGAETFRCYDVGVAGIHRLFANLEQIRRADVIIAVAGMEGALGGVLAGLVSSPVVAVPTSVGYGASFGGIAPLLTMLNSCAEGMSVVNIDNGFGAGVLACRILRKINQKGGNE